MAEQLQTESGGPGKGFLAEAGWLGAGFVLPCASLTFYRRAVRRPVVWAVVFFVVFGLVGALLATAAVGRVMFAVSGEIDQAFATGEFPAITISRGVATVDGEEPFVLSDERDAFFVVDTTGVYEEIDRSRYSQGILLTRTEMHVLDEDGSYERASLSDINLVFGDPIVVDGPSMERLWTVFSGFAVVLSFLAIAAWNVLVRLAYVALLALAIWGIAALVRPGTGFGPVFITGLYATVPAVYLHYLLGLLGVRFIFFYSAYYLPTWIVALVVALAAPGEGLLRERPLRGWRALIGVPALLLFAVDVVIELPRRALILWPAALLTFAALVAVGLWTALKGREAGEAAPPAPVGEPLAEEPAATE